MARDPAAAAAKAPPEGAAAGPLPPANKEPELKITAPAGQVAGTAAA